MSVQVPRFTVGPNFQNELRKRVMLYFEEKKKATTGNWQLYSKAIVLIVAHIAFYSLAVFSHTSVWLSLFYCVMVAALTAGIGFNIMHDGAHGSFSKSKTLNEVAAFSLNVLGGNDFMWKLKHNVMHHTFTNIDGADDDIDAEPLMRMCASQPRYWFHRFQHIYGVVVYCFVYAIWIFVLDYQKYFSQKVVGLPITNMRFKDHFLFWAGKVCNLTLFIVIPIISVGVADALIGFGVFVMITGLLITLVFQLAHAVEHTDYPEVTGENKIENEWAIHQVQTTANFATKNRLVTWYCGGLNFQIEHHLFPKISHVHYPQISKIVRETCADFNLKYNEFPKMSGAIVSHFRHLREMGKGS
jgi:linoleoyl-CoA desaturase